MTKRWWMLAPAALALAAVGCAPADVSGTYTLNITNADNGCNLGNWTVGQSTSNVDFVITQSGSTITGQGGSGLGGAGINLVLDAWLGSHAFNGDVSGSSFQMSIQGMRAGSQGSCAYTWNADISGTITGDAIQGTVTYHPSTNHNADCGTLDTCQSIQHWNGTRPPR